MKAARTLSRSAGCICLESSSNATIPALGSPQRSNPRLSIEKELSSTFQDHKATQAASIASLRCSGRHRKAASSIFCNLIHPQLKHWLGQKQDESKTRGFAFRLTAPIESIRAEA